MDDLKKEEPAIVEPPAPVDPPPPAEQVAPEVTIEERVAVLEDWARGAHTTEFRKVMVPEKVAAFYKTPDGKIEKHMMFLMDYTSAKKNAPDVWTTDEPAKDVEVIDKTHAPHWEQPEPLKEPEPKPALEPDRKPLDEPLLDRPEERPPLSSLPPKS